MKKQQMTIIAGRGTSEAREQATCIWLLQHGAIIEEYQGLQVITLRQVEVERGQYRDQYVVDFNLPDGEQEASNLVISLDPDPRDTRLEIEYDGDYSCSCLGRGCFQCNEELAAVARGENPYAHYLPAVEVQPDPPLLPLCETCGYPL